MSEWQNKRLGELISIKHGYAFQGEYFSEQGPGPILLTPGNFAIGGGFKESKPKYYLGPIPEEFRLHAGDLVITMTDLSRQGDTLGYPAIVPGGAEYLHNQRIGLVVVNDSARVDRRFLSYALRPSDYRHYILAGATGSTVRHTSPGRIADYSFPLPGLEEQKSIASILGALDDKITVNHRIGATTDDFLGAEFIAVMCENERTARIGDLVALKYGKALKEADRSPGEVPVFGGNGRSGWHNVPLDSGPGVIIGRKGANAGSVSWSQGPFWAIDTSFYVEPLSPELPLEFLYFLLDGAGLRDHVGDSAIPGLNREIALNCTVQIPSREQIEGFKAKAIPLLKSKEQKVNESQSLTELRDYLLPRLMSGEIRVRDAEKAVEDVT